jgi:hypothetical protein
LTTLRQECKRIATVILQKEFVWFVHGFLEDTLKDADSDTREDTRQTIIDYDRFFTYLVDQDWDDHCCRCQFTGIEVRLITDWEHPGEHLWKGKEFNDDLWPKVADAILTSMGLDKVDA